jgi:hypothetical protein
VVAGANKAIRDRQCCWLLRNPTISASAPASATAFAGGIAAGVGGCRRCSNRSSPNSRHTRSCTFSGESAGQTSSVSAIAWLLGCIAWATAASMRDWHNSNIALVSLLPLLVLVLDLLLVWERGVLLPPTAPADARLARPAGLAPASDFATTLSTPPLLLLLLLFLPTTRAYCASSAVCAATAAESGASSPASA